jgi:hypothetical protein
MTTVRRSEGSIERKLQNISAVLDLLGVQWINGYKPLAHYQDALVSAVERLLGREQGFLYPASPEVQPAEPGEDGILIPPPPFSDPDKTLTPAVRRLVGKFDPGERDARNRELGKAGDGRTSRTTSAGCRTWTATASGMTSGRSSPMARSGCSRSRRRAATNVRPSGSPGERSRLPQRRATSTGSGAFSTSATAPRCSRSLRRWTAHFPFRPRHFKPSLDSQRLAEASRAGRGPSHSGCAVTDREMPCDSDLEELASQQRASTCDGRIT